MIEQEGLKFIGVVKTATKMFPMKHLQSIELQNRGDRVGLVRRKEEGDCDLLAFSWNDRERKYLSAQVPAWRMANQTSDKD